MRLLGYIVFLGTSILWVSCSQDSNKDNQEVAQTQIDSSSSEEPKESQGASYNLPSPLQIATIFKKSGMKYMEGLTSQQKDPSKYTTNFEKSVNLGVYAADLSYCVLNQQTQEALNYLKISRQLADQLGMTSVFEENSLSTRFEKNLGNEDSLAYIIAELQMNTDMYLQDNEKEYVSTIVFSGAWLESIYIGSKVFKDPGEKKVCARIHDQMVILSSLIKVLSAQVKKDANIKTLVEDFTTLKDQFDEFASVKKLRNAELADTLATTQDKINATSHSRRLELILSTGEFAALGRKIEEMRNKIIKN